ncbi:cytochrome c oxidase assembly factor Coa1 family protein [Halioxenophilus sp. WMMB6]|uniref:cytochrome c oxidase assembly factor Coa1 family protein n=1 Tax=Halioxenophilus sp. WMMB6 TaxID=3073815 RepID=UPI00295E775D|nr:cytochrome c oxidase assembly factor Coa1 family protein [Halioxenophilus sp. WMMB6]
MVRNLKWILLGLLLALLVFALMATFVFFLMRLMMGEAYQLSWAAVNSSPAVVAVIGEPIEPGWFVLGSVSTSGPEGSAALQYSITGSLNTGMVYLMASKVMGEWQLDQVIVRPEGAAAINVVPKAGLEESRFPADSAISI